MTAEIFQFPERRTCHLCVHYAQLSTAGYCQMLDKLVREPVEVAMKCPAFETRGADEDPDQ